MVILYALNFLKKGEDSCLKTYTHACTRSYITIFHSFPMVKVYKKKPTSCFHLNKFLEKFSVNPQALVAQNYPPPPFLNFLFTNLFSIKFLSLFIYYFTPFYLILTCSCPYSLQSYVNSNFHVSTLYKYPRGKKLRKFKNRTPAHFGYLL